MVETEKLFDQIKEIECVLEEIVYKDEESGYTVAKVAPLANEKGQITAVGKMASVLPGQNLTLKGNWVIHPKYGRQFKVTNYQVDMPATEEGIKKYLSSGLIKGIGPSIAERITDRWGEEALSIIEETPDKLEEIEGIGPHRLENIKKAWKEQEDIREVMLFLKSHDVSTNYGVKIYKTYGKEAIKKLKENPYRLTEDIFGIGFKTADKIAMKLGMDQSSLERIKAGVEYTLKQASDEGHTFLPKRELEESCVEILEVKKEPIRQAINELFYQEKIILEELKEEKTTKREVDQAVYLAPFYFSEKGVADRLSEISSTPRKVKPGKVDQLINQLGNQKALEYNSDQKNIIRQALVNKVMVITGGPGTGKTTTVKGIIRLMERLGWEVNLAAPTGRAAKRLSQATGRESKTIHRMLKFRPPNQFLKNEDNPLDADAIIIDELSMVDLILMYNLLKAIPDKAHLILVGDADQLPSVGAGNVLKDLIKSGTIKVGQLTEIFRQAGESQIVINAHLINSGQFPRLKNSPRNDFFFIEEKDSREAAQLVAELASKRVPTRFDYDPFQDVQVLTPMHRGPSGVDHLNRTLQERLNPASRTQISFTTRRFKLGDKVMQIRNNYQKDIFNGDIGKIIDVEKREKRVMVRFPDRGIVSYESTDLNELVLAYAITIHKSQGNEYRSVIMPILTQHYIMLQRNLLYTALTRAKELAVFVGSKKAIGIAVNNDKEELRYSLLSEKLKTVLSPKS